MIVIRLSLTSSLFYGHFYTDTKSKRPYPLISSTHLSTISSISLSGSIFLPIPTDIFGKRKSEAYIVHWSQTSFIKFTKYYQLYFM